MVKLPPRLVVFDTNVVEGIYLPFLLRGDPIRDLIRLRTEAPCYTPAICVKTLYEIMDHLKLGGKKWPWLHNPEFGYPGGLEEGERILAQSLSFAGSANAMYHFNHIEEFSFRCWSDHLQFAKSLPVESAHDTLEENYAALEEFALEGLPNPVSGSCCQQNRTRILRAGAPPYLWHLPGSDHISNATGARLGMEFSCAERRFRNPRFCACCRRQSPRYQRQQATNERLKYEFELSHSLGQPQSARNCHQVPLRVPDLQVKSVTEG
jgi:hypothetical protein